jgi:uncharacterized pyridoxal phosphate-containing UPF0001 family protein
VQESYGKWPELKQQYPDTRLHLIGPLQSNKTREAVELFDCIETLDREKLAKTLAKEIQAIGRSPELFIQVNTGLEPQKAGIAPDAIDGFVKDCRTIHDLPVTGLMCIPPVDEEPALHFALLVKLGQTQWLTQTQHGHEWRLRNSYRDGGNPCPGWQRNIWLPGLTTSIRDQITTLVR